MTQQNATDVQFIAPQESGVDIKKWFYRILLLWPWIFLSIIICATIAFVYIRSTEPVFRSIASVMVEDKEKGGGSLENPLMKDLNLSGAGKIIENEIIVLKSRDLMKDVVLSEQLYIDLKRKGTLADQTVYRLDAPVLLEVENPESISGSSQFAIYKQGNIWMMSSNLQQSISVQFGKRYMLGDIYFKFLHNDLINEVPNSSKMEKYIVSIVPISAAVNTYISRLQVESYSKTASILTLSMVDNNPKKVSATLNSLINIYSLHSQVQKNQETANAVNFLNIRLDTIEKSLVKVEGDIQYFQTRNNVFDIATEANNNIQTSATLNIQRANQETQIDIINELEKTLVDKKDTMVASTLGIVEPSLGGFIQKYNLLVMQKAKLSQQAGVKNPVMIDLENQIKDTKSGLLESVKSLKNANYISLNNLNNRNNVVKNRIGVVPQLQKELIQIKRNQSVQEQLYVFLLQKREESAIKLASSTTDTRTVEKPYSLGQIKPINKEIWTIGISMGFLLPIAIFALFSFFDNKVEDKKEIEKSTFSPLLGEIAYIRKLNNPIQINSKSRSVVAEQLRAIRTSISYTGKGELTKCILVTSQRSGEGKSFVSLNLAASYSQLGKKVVVMEFDLRKPKIARSLGLDPKLGISTFLSRDISIDEIIIPLPETDGNLFLVPSGPLPPNSSELILGQKMVDLMKILNERFDYIIIDTPPFGIITDATLLQKYADLNVVVLRQGYTFKQVYQELNQRILQFPAHPLYIVLNGVGKTQTYRYNSAYGYSNGYFEEDKKAAKA